VPSVEAAELLLALAGDPGRWWQPAQLGDSLEPFRCAGVLETGPDGRVRYCAQDEQVAAHVRMLALAYKARPVTLFRVIYALRDLKIHSFADAFKLKRK